jgi:uncharacterized protein (DUF58 family)
MRLPDMDELLGMRCEVQGLRVRARIGTRAQVAGTHRSKHRGRGLEFQEVREYVSGDDPRTIDWRVTARRGRPHTKVFHEERERPVWLLVDLSPAMFFGSRVQLKSTLAVRAAAFLAWSAALRGDRVGGIVIGATSVRVIPPRAREAGLLQLLQTLTQMQPNSVAAPVSDQFRAGVHSLASLARPGSLVIAISDFTSLDVDSNGDYDRIARHTDLRLIWIMDALEKEGLPDGRFRVWLPGHSRTLDGASVRDAWSKRWQQRENRVKELAQSLGSTVIQLNTHESVTDALRELLTARQAAA